MSMLHHWSQVQEKHTTVVGFFEWLEEEGISVEFTRQEDGSGILESPSMLADQFLDVDRRRLDDERRELLKGLG